MFWYGVMCGAFAGGAVGVWGTLVAALYDPARHVGYNSLMSETDLFNAIQCQKRMAYRKARGLPLE
jgi:hypothetical protein